MIPRKPKLITRMQLKGSSNVKSYGYDKTAGILQVEFYSGVVGDYLDVPSPVVERFEAAESKGQFLSAHVKPSYKWRVVQKAAAEQLVDAAVATPIYLALLQTKKLMRKTGGNLLYSLWVATGREQTRKTRDTKFKEAFDILEEAGGKIGGEKGLELAIQLAAKRKI